MPSHLVASPQGYRLWRKLHYTPLIVFHIVAFTKNQPVGQEYVCGQYLLPYMEFQKQIIFSIESMIHLVLHIILHETGVAGVETLNRLLFHNLAEITSWPESLQMHRQSGIVQITKIIRRTTWSWLGPK
ncbi:unnamed protein product [Caretta caretta]